MMKKRIVALLLAGLMATAALTSCRVQTNDNDNPGGTEPNQNNNQTTMGSWDILVRATLEKTNQGWIVVDTKEHP